MNFVELKNNFQIYRDHGERQKRHEQPWDCYISEIRNAEAPEFVAVCVEAVFNIETHPYVRKDLAESLLITYGIDKQLFFGFVKNVQWATVQDSYDLNDLPPQYKGKFLKKSFLVI